MREELYIETNNEAFVISADVVNGISEYLVAATETEKDLENLAIIKYKEQEARKKALIMAFKEYPNPIGIVSLEYRRELTEKRNELVEQYFNEIMTGLK